MNLASYRVPLDIHETLSQAVIPFKQYDSGRRIEFCLREDGRNYVIDEHMFAVLRAKKPDGTVLYNTCATIDNMFVYDLTNQTSAALGTVECELTVYSADNRQITSPRFTFVIEDNIYDDDIVESTNEFTQLVSAINAANTIDVSVEQTEDGIVVTVIKKDGTEEEAEILNPSEEEVKQLVEEWFEQHSSEVNAVLYDVQVKTESEKAQARSNIGAISQADTFSRTKNGTVPMAPGGVGTTKYLREDGTWNNPALSGLGDTDITTPAHNDNLMYDAVAGKWKNVANSVVKYIEQSLTDSQKLQARTNIGVNLDNLTSKVSDATAGNIATLKADGSYKDSGVSLDDVGGGMNPNLIDNGHFIVNQRGQTDYTQGYTVDRWVLEGTNAALHINSDKSLNLISTDTQYDINLTERFNHSYFKEGVYTLSVKCNGVITSGQLNYSNDRFEYNRMEFTDGNGVKGVIRITHGEYHHNISISPVEKNTTVSNIEAVKLEVGASSTLVNEFPVYCDEILRCISSTQVAADTYTGKGLSANGVGLSTPSFKSIYAGTTEMEDGVTELATGVIYLQYEE